MASTVSNGNDRSEKWQRPFQMATTVYERELNRRRRFIQEYMIRIVPVISQWKELGNRFKARCQEMNVHTFPWK